ncbi:MAG: hypothetical protein KKE04_03935 [Candidatus Thermoplasmatota archaeon]|nr:hypothetical protein [Candidatus Thermoplasmatota archaeon]MBU4256474.1 hypothetical protein [Candidatus Thermoplasmatota archaeon]
MEKIKAGAIVVFVIGLLGIILSAAWDLIASKSECNMGNCQIAGIVGGVIVAVVGAVLLVYKPKIKEEKEEEKKEEKPKEKKEKK